MDETLRRAAPVSFVIALLCFLLPFVDVSCSGHTVAEVSGVELAIGATKPPAESAGASDSIEIRPRVSATFAVLSALGALAATVQGRKRGEGLAAISALLAVAFLGLLHRRVVMVVEETGHGSLDVSFLPAYWISALSLLAGAGALFVRAGLEPGPESPPPDERDPTTIPSEPHGT
jgi:hypothetical protein